MTEFADQDLRMLRRAAELTQAVAGPLVGPERVHALDTIQHAMSTYIRDQELLVVGVGSRSRRSAGCIRPRGAVGEALREEEILYSRPQPRSGECRDLESNWTPCIDFGQ